MTKRGESDCMWVYLDKYNNGCRCDLNVRQRKLGMFALIQGWFYWAPGQTFVVIIEWRFPEACRIYAYVCANEKWEISLIPETYAIYMSCRSISTTSLRIYVCKLNVCVWDWLNLMNHAGLSECCNCKVKQYTVLYWPVIRSQAENPSCKAFYHNTSIWDFC